jgi:hypothetical protein
LVVLAFSRFSVRDVVLSGALWGELKPLIEAC